MLKIPKGFSQANNHASVAKVLSALPAVIEKARANGYRVRGYVSCVITCPYSGQTAPEQVISVAKRLLDYGCYEVSLGDTTGEGNPEAWRALWAAAENRDLPMTRIAVGTPAIERSVVKLIVFFNPIGTRQLANSKLICQSVDPNIVSRYLLHGPVLDPSASSERVAYR